MKNIMIDWKGIVPTEDTKSQTEQILGTLKYILPPDSDIHICLEKYSKNFEGHIVVKSPMGHFAAHAGNKDLFNLCKGLRKNLKQQIFRHRESRTGFQRAS